ncbi:hypothetical protein TNCV_4945691 [Trichonephila clavipes]|nr:hypothetical protein TNCV_4945691 [Trichonephila clavipes]
MVAIHSGMGTERVGLVSSQAKPAEIFSRKVLFDDLAKADNSLDYLQVLWDRTHSGQGFLWLFTALFCYGGSFVNVCGYNTLCSSEGQGDFRLR